MDVTSGEATAAGRARWLELRRPIAWVRNVDGLVYTATFIWGALFAAAAMLEQHFFVLRRYDLGNFTQAIWSTAHGHFLQVTEVGGANLSRLGIHVDPIIVGLVPLWWIWSSPNLLLVAHVIALGLGAFPLYWLGRKHLPSKRDAGLMTAAYLMCPAVAWSALGEFDAIVLAVPLLLLGIWFLDEDRLWPFLAVAAVVVLCQEQVGLIVACLGAVYGFRSKRWSASFVIVIFGLGVTLVDLQMVLPHFSNGSPYNARFAGLGGSASGVLSTSVAHPLHVVTRVFSPLHLLGLGLLIAPVLALCLRSAVMWAAAPQLAFVLLSARPGDIAPGSQNVLAIIPFVFAGAVYALSRNPTSKWRSEHVLVASLGCCLFMGPLNPVLFPSVSLRHVAAERRAVALVPRTAAVSVTNHLGSHLAARRYLYVFPVLGRATWIVVDKQDHDLPDMRWLRTRHGTEVGVVDLPTQPELMRRELRKLERSPRWRRVFSSDGVMVFTRRHVTSLTATP